MIQILVVVLLVGYPLGYLAHRWRLRGVFMRGTKALAEQVADLRIAIETERDKTSRYFAKISGMKDERDGWQKLYTEQSIGHGNAQNLMMGEIEKLARSLAAKGVRYNMPRILQEVREEFLGKYEAPARAGAPLPDAIMASRQKLEPPPEIA